MSSKQYNFEGFVGEFKDLLIKFIEFKQSLGYNYSSTADVLKRFSKFSLNYEIRNHTLTKELVMAWSEKRAPEHYGTWSSRVNKLKQFALYLHNLGYDSYIPICSANPKRDLYVPYIFTAQQLRVFFENCGKIKQHPRTNKHLMLPAVYRILYGCGLRISETMALKLKHVDLKNGIITIHNSKFNKDRLIPMSYSLTEYFKVYFSKIHIFSTSEDYLFMKKDRTAFASNTVYKHFRKILWRSGISHGGKGRGPRLHDFRHTFAVHSLSELVNKGFEVYSALPILATYLGHSSLKETEKYLRITAEAYPEILKKVNQTCSYVIPEVNLK